MTILLDNGRVMAWMERFSEADKPLAATLLRTLRLVSADEFSAGLTALLEKRLQGGDDPIALYNESERRQRGGIPHRLFKESERAPRRAYGTSGPPLVPRQRNIDEEVGSEGTVATILTQFARSRRAAVSLSPGPDTIRARAIRRFVLVTDFIGSGERVEKFLDAAWRVRSVRSWWSRRDEAGLRFEVVAYSGTDAGMDRVARHPCQPVVHIAHTCPTIANVFDAADATDFEDLCIRYGPGGARGFPLGYGRTGALIAFAHSMPNNAPAMFWKRYGGREPLFPSRVTGGVDSPFHEGTTEAARQDRLRELAGLATAPEMVPFRLDRIVLAALGRSPRSTEAVSARLGIELERVEKALATLTGLGMIGARNLPTDRGRSAIAKIKGQTAPGFVPKAPKTDYFPVALRVPRDV